MTDEMHFKIKVEELQQDDNEPCCDPLRIDTKCELKEEIKTEPGSPPKTIEDIHFAECWVTPELNDISEFSPKTAEELTKTEEMNALDMEFPAESDSENTSSSPCPNGENVASDSEAFVCTSGPSTFLTQKPLTDHLTTHDIEDNDLTSTNSLGIHKCHICGKEFKTKLVLNRHTLIHRDKKNFQCAVCQKRFLQKPDLKRHMLKGHKCEVCGKKFKQLNALYSHVIIHEPVKPIWCSICQKRFSRKAELKRHRCTMV